MPFAVVALDFDPTLRLGDLTVRLETLGLAAAALAALLVAALIARRTPVWTGALEDQPLRLDDLLFVALSAIPGAVIGARLGYVLIHLDYYRANPLAVVDPGQGSLELAVGVAGAAITGGYAARLLTGAAGPWFHVAAIPTLLVIGIGKAANALGGTGQGALSDLPWATAYVGPGVWGSLAPGLPSHPAQLYEAAAVAVIAVALVMLSAGGGFTTRDGLAWIVAVGSWLAARAAIAGTWRDAPVLGPLNGPQLLALVVLAGLAVALLVRGREGRPDRSAATVEPRWPDPETRPPF